MYENKKIVILGMARSGYEVARLLSKYNNDIIITDTKEQDLKKNRGIIRFENCFCSDGKSGSSCE